jgi:hypothetical protein
MTTLNLLDNINNIVEKSERYIEIYKITNTVTTKIYIGQTVSHILNHNKYRRFGCVKRLDGHISEAIRNNKKNQCHYLNNSIRKHGGDKFIVELIDKCDMNSGDETEAKYIKQYKSMFPIGYNLKIGGTVFQHTEESRSRLSVSGLKYFEKQRLDKYKDVILPEDIKDYNIYIIECNKHYTLNIGNIISKFTSSIISKEKLKMNAIEFIKKLYKIKEEEMLRNILLRETPNPQLQLAIKTDDVVLKDTPESTKKYNAYLQTKKNAKKFNYICKNCSIQKTITDFRKYHHSCKICERIKNNIRNKDRYIKNKEKGIKRIRKKRNYKANVGLEIF